MSENWLEELKEHVESRPIALLRLTDSNWSDLKNAMGGLKEFSIARPRSELESVKAPTLCLYYQRNEKNGPLYLGILASRHRSTTLDVSVKLKHGCRIHPTSEEELRRLVTAPAHAKSFIARLDKSESGVLLTPKMSSHLLDQLASIDSNRRTIQRLGAVLCSPKIFGSNASLQQDAIETALEAFGLRMRDRASSVEVFPDKPSTLDQLGFVEDTVIEHEARSIPGFKLNDSDLTGRAVFDNGGERLLVITANRRQLEECFGVDLVYINQTRKSIVMLQYKMLENNEDDWIYRPDKQLNLELQRMRQFDSVGSPAEFEYRLNPGVFFLKCVHRNAKIKSGGIILPLSHFEMLCKQPSSRGPRGGVRISFKSLDGYYLRRHGFIELLRAGYIGAYSQGTAHFETIIDAILDGNRAVVAAIHTGEKD